MDRVKLVGLDFGSTTTSMMIAEAGLRSNCATGRMAFSDTEIVFKPPAVFTPFDGDCLNLAAIETLLNQWLADARLERTSIFSGGAIVTGLAARRSNVAGLRGLISAAIGDAILATADDPRLESWLAFMGSAAALSRHCGGREVLNLDIGGGTTNPALGADGHVTATGSAYIGARHIRVRPGSYEIEDLSVMAEAMLDQLGIVARQGQALTAADVERFVALQVQALEALVTGETSFFKSALGRRLEQAPFHLPVPTDPIVTFSGGVGELIYSAVAGAPLPPQTFFGDLGIDLARAILNSPRLSRDLAAHVPETQGRATVQGMTLNSTEISGTTLFLPSAHQLPLSDLPVVTALPLSAGQAQIRRALQLAEAASGGACILVESSEAAPGVAPVKAFGEALKAALAAGKPDLARPLVLLATANVAKAIGNYATDWKQSGQNLIVIDEIVQRDAQFVTIGKPRHCVVPVSFYGMRDTNQMTAQPSAGPPAVPRGER